jgi:hypothetical protein
MVQALIIVLPPYLLNFLPAFPFLSTNISKFCCMECKKVLHAGIKWKARHFSSNHMSLNGIVWLLVIMTA